MRLGLIFSLVFLLLAGALHAADPTPKLKVGVFERPPFAMKDETGHWIGIAVDLWERVADRLGLSYEYVETPLDQMFTDLNQGKLDLALGEVGVSADREKLADFTQPFITTTLAAAVPARLSQTTMGDIWAGVTNNGILTVMIIMFATLFLFSWLLWLLERGVHQTHFGGKPIHGFGSALWFSAVTMTTVGYGDKTPQTGLGRFLAFVWMFLGILLVGAFTGSVASSITLSSLNTQINHVRDLNRFQTGVAAASVAQEALTRAGLRPQAFANVETGMQALADHHITAFVSDEVTLKYMVQRNYSSALRISVIARTHLAFAMATRPNYPGLQDLNVPIIELTNQPEWQDRLNYWLGPSASE